eukprot:1152429-Heterocapsa_arctica.AAC.1
MQDEALPEQNMEQDQLTQGAVIEINNQSKQEDTDQILVKQNDTQCSQQAKRRPQENTEDGEFPGVSSQKRI